ncbi:MAG: hypothetical protein Kow00124_31800 [Anaerolineae bacterium]
MELAILVLILLTAVGLRVTALRSAPPGLRFDELINADQVDTLLAGRFTLYFADGGGREPLFHYLGAAMWSVFERDMITLRLVAALCGFALVVLGWALARRLFGVQVGLLTAAGLAVGFVPLYYSRVALHAAPLPPLTALAAYALWHGLAPDGRSARWPLAWMLVGGLALGLTIYTHPAGRVLPVMLLVFVGYLAAFHRAVLRGGWPGLLVWIAAAALVAYPLIAYLIANPGVDQSLHQLAGPLNALRAGDPLPLLTGIGRTLGMFIGRGDADWLYNIAGRPYFPAPLALLFYSGVILALIRWRRPAYLLAVLLLLGGLLPGMLSSRAPAYLDTVNSLPVVFIFPALALADAVGWLARRLPDQIGLFRTLVGIMVAAFALREGHAYFGTWVRAPEVRAAHTEFLLEAARYLERNPQIEAAAISAPGVDYYTPWDRRSMELTLHRPLPLRWFYGEDSLIIPAADGPVWLIVMDNAPLLADWLYVLSQAELVGQVTTINDTPALTIYRLPSSQDAAQTLIAGNPTNPTGWASQTVLLPEERPVVGGVVALRARRIAGLVFQPGETIRLQTVWEVQAVPSPPLLVFVHLIDAQGGLRAGWDDLDVPPEGWQPGDVFALNHELAIPPDLPPGDYFIYTGFYSPETLARLPVRLGDEPIRDRILLETVHIGGG